MSSLILYSGASYTGTSLLVAHGQTGELASATALDYLSVGVADMQAFCWSAVSTTQATDYQYHTESLISASIASLAALYPPDQTQYPMRYLGIDPAVATPVWLDMSQVSGDINALAATSLVGGSTTSMTTLSRTGVDGVLAFIGMAGGSSVVATCSYGSYDEASGQVDWTAPNAGTLVLEYTGGAVVLLAATGFPDGWTFGAPKVQPDGSWMIAVSGVVKGNVISSLSASKETLMNDGTDAVTLTATVTDGTTGQPVSGVSVNWHAALGNLSADTSVTDASGQATARLTDSGDTGAIVVTASLDDGSQQDITITLTDAAAGQTLVSLTSDKDSIENDGTDTANLIAIVHNADGSVAEGVTVTWRTTLGSLSHKTQDTNSRGVSKAKLTDSGDTGPATVVASLANGSKLTCVIAVEDKSDSYVISALTSDKDTILNNGIDSATLTATVHDGSGNTVSGVRVFWNTTAGNLNAISSVTNSNGQATATLTDSGAAGTATVTALLANGSNMTRVITVEDKSASYVISALTSDKDTIINDGIDAATLTATVHDGSGKAVSGVTVYWRTTAGNLNAISSVTNSNGQATAKLTDTINLGTATVTASLANGSQLIHDITMEDKSLSFVISSLTSDKSSIVNDGIDAATLTATVQDGSGKAVPGVTVNWNTTAGNLSTGGSGTNSNGQATVTLTDSGAAGTAAVTASVASISQMTCTIIVEDKSASYVVSALSSDKSSIVNDGTDAATLTATVHDGSGKAVSGVKVNWNTTTGNLSAASSVTNSNGLATVKLTDSSTPGTATVTASLANGSQQTRAITVKDKSTGYVVSALTSDKDTIINDGTDAATLTATVHDGSGKAVSGVKVNWNTTTGNLSAASSVTSSNGLATVKLTDSGAAGTATVTASLANGSQLTHAITVKDKSAGYVVSALTSDKSSIRADYIDAATLTAMIKDSDGNAVEGVTVSWRTTLGVVTPPSKTDKNGKATTQLTSYDVGTATVTARLDNGNFKSIDVEVSAFVSGSENFNATEGSGDHYAGYTETFSSGLRLTILAGTGSLHREDSSSELKTIFTFNGSNGSIGKSRFDIPNYAHTQDPGYARSLDFTWGSFYQELGTITFYDENDRQTGSITATHFNEGSYTSESYTIPGGGYYTYFIVSMPEDDYDSALLDNLRWY